MTPPSAAPLDRWLNAAATPRPASSPTRYIDPPPLPAGTRSLTLRLRRRGDV